MLIIFFLSLERMYFVSIKFYILWNIISKIQIIKKTLNSHQRLGDFFPITFIFLIIFLNIFFFYFHLCSFFRDFLLSVFCLWIKKFKWELVHTFVVFLLRYLRGLFLYILKEKVNKNNQERLLQLLMLMLMP